MKRKGRASIHTWKSWWKGHSCFQTQSSKLAHAFKLQSLAHSFTNRTAVNVLPATSVPQTNKQNLQNFTDITQVQDPPNPLKPPNKQKVQGFTHKLHKITSSLSFHTLLCLHEAAAVGTRSVHSTTVKYGPGFSAALHHCKNSARQNSSWEDACASFCGQLHSGILVENNVLDVSTAIITAVETVSVMWFLLFKFQDS